MRHEDEVRAIIDNPPQETIEALMVPGGGTAVIDFWAPWCGPCRSMAPAFKAVAERFADAPVTFYKIDTEARPEFGRAFNVRSLPSIVFIHDGTVQDVLIGAQSAGTLSAKVDWLLSKARGEGLLTRLLGLHRTKGKSE
ncbi:MAG: thioredoxin family protein [Myxococcota bacterium]